jgi:uncharacterized protein
MLNKLFLFIFIICKFDFFEMKTILFSLSFLLIIKFSYSQITIPLGLNSYSHEQLDSEMINISNNVLEKYKENDYLTYLDNTYAIQSMAGLYKESMNSIYSYRKEVFGKDSIEAKGFCFQYESYIKAKILSDEKYISISEAFNRTFLNNFNQLNSSASILASGYFNCNLERQKNRFFDKLKQIKGDTISIEFAINLCNSYGSYKVCKDIGEIGSKIIKKEEERLFIIEDSLLIDTRNGAKISAIVVRKREIKEKTPTIFIFNIYPGASDLRNAKEAALNGYSCVIANTRGKALSMSEMEPFEHDANDAYDLINWISKQAWNNGKIGMYGGSYNGFNQWAAVKNIHPALKTIVPQAAVGVGTEFPLEYGVFQSYMLKWIHYVCNNKYTDNDDFDNLEHWNNSYKKWYKSGLPFNKLDSIEGRNSVIFQRWISHPSFDSFWQNMIPYKNDYSKINIPVLTITGYYDSDQPGALNYFKQHHLFNKNTNHYLVIGPYEHEGAQSVPLSVLGNYEIDSVANVNFSSLVYDWFDYILKDSTKPTLLNDKINYQPMNSNKWMHKSKMHQINNDTLKFYLDKPYINKTFSLLKTAPTKTEWVNQLVDFKDRSDSNDVIADYSETIIDSTLEIHNSLFFKTEPILDSLSINGSFMAQLNAMINKKDMDLNIYLFEEQANGKYFYLSNFLCRASFAKNISKRQLLKPNIVETIPISAGTFVSKKIDIGSKIVLVISINKSPKHQINYGTGKDVSTESIKDAGEPLQIKWYNDSYIKIPVWREGKISK